MKKVVLSLMVLFVVMGCATTYFVELDEEGKVIKETKVVYPIWGARKIKELEIDLKEGKISLGSLDRNAGAVGETMRMTAETLLNVSKVVERVTGLPVP